MAAAAATVKKVALELGGKNPNVVFADADFETAVDFALTAVFLHSGQVCSAGARLVVQDAHARPRSSTSSSRRAERIRLGGPFDAEAETGPLISAAHRAKVEAYVAAGLAEGAVLRCGGGARTTRRWPTASSTGRPSSTAADRTCACVQRGVVRPGADRGALHRRGRRRAHRQRHRSTAWPARSGPRTPARPSGSPGGCGTARSGSTTTTRTCRRRSGAASSSRASAASSARPAWTSTARPSTSGRTSDPRPQRWFGG